MFLQGRRDHAAEAAQGRTKEAGGRTSGAERRDGGLEELALHVACDSFIAAYLISPRFYVLCSRLLCVVRQQSHAVLLRTAFFAVGLSLVVTTVIPSQIHARSLASGSLVLLDDDDEEVRETWAV